MASETTDLVSGGGGAEDEARGEAPPREPSSATALLALRNAPLQRHAEDEQKKQHRLRRRHHASPTLYPPSWANRHARAIELETEVGSKTKSAARKEQRLPTGGDWVRVAA